TVSAPNPAMITARLAAATKTSSGAGIIFRNSHGLRTRAGIATSASAAGMAVQAAVAAAPVMRSRRVRVGIRRILLRVLQALITAVSADLPQPAQTRFDQ